MNENIISLGSVTFKNFCNYLKVPLCENYYNSIRRLKFDKFEELENKVIKDIRNALQSEFPYNKMYSIISKNYILNIPISKIINDESRLSLEETNKLFSKEEFFGDSSTIIYNNNIYSSYYGSLTIGQCGKIYSSDNSKTYPDFYVFMHNIEVYMEKECIYVSDNNKISMINKLLKYARKNTEDGICKIHTQVFLILCKWRSEIPAYYRFESAKSKDKLSVKYKFDFVETDDQLKFNTKKSIDIVSEFDFIEPSSELPELPWVIGVPLSQTTSAIIKHYSPQNMSIDMKELYRDFSYIKCNRINYKKRLPDVNDCDIFEEHNDYNKIMLLRMSHCIIREYMRKIIKVENIIVSPNNVHQNTSTTYKPELLMLMEYDIDNYKNTKVSESDYKDYGHDKLNIFPGNKIYNSLTTGIAGRDKKEMKIIMDHLLFNTFNILDEIHNDIVTTNIVNETNVANEECLSMSIAFYNTLYNEINNDSLSMIDSLYEPFYELIDKELGHINIIHLNMKLSDYVYDNLCSIVEQSFDKFKLEVTNLREINPSNWFFSNSNTPINIKSLLDKKID